MTTTQKYRYPVTGTSNRLVSDKLNEHISVKDFGASPGASGAANLAAIQAALNHVKAEGGTLVFEPRVTYQVGGELDFQNSDPLRTEYPRNINGQGCTLDFSASGITNGVCLNLGATSLGNAAQVTWSDVENLTIIGPENATNITPRYWDNPSTNAVAATLVIGVRVEFGLNVNLRNIYVSRCWKGFRYHQNWRAEYVNVKAHKCIIGHHIDAGCTHMTMVNPAAEYCTYPFLIRPDTLSASITTITLIGALIENSSTGFTLDPNTNATTGSEIQNITILNPYIEKVFYDHFRVGLEFSASPAAAGTRGGSRTGYISSLVVENARFTGEGEEGDPWSDDRKAFVFASPSKLASGRISAPCAITDTINFPRRVAFQALARSEDIATQEITSFGPGDGWGHFNSEGATLYAHGNVASCTKVGTGTYDVNFVQPYKHDDSYAPVVTSRVSGYYCAISDAGTNFSKVRVEVRDAAGTLQDGRFTLHVAGIMAAY